MGLVVSTYGQKKNLDSYIDSLLQYAWLRLFKNDIDPNEDTVVGDFSEADYSGYSPFDLSASGVWSIPAINASGKMQTVFPELTFAHSGGGTSNDIYGYFVYDLAGGALIYSERFTDAPYAMDVPADQINIALRFTAETEFGIVPVP